MTEPQVWTALGVLAAALAGVITVTTQLMTRHMAALFSGLRTEMVLRFEHLEGHMDRFETRMDRFESRMDRLEKRVDGIDRDVQAISKRVFPE
ncbi:MAG: hypothetical protein D3X82_12945 [Candidatus Leucobacter sulfamidivorax]|nr:hypothetical protein [Candidatus Leucobacter sulfamidivorax]